MSKSTVEEVSDYYRYLNGIKIVETALSDNIFSVINERDEIISRIMTLQEFVLLDNLERFELPLKEIKSYMDKINELLKEFYRHLDKLRQGLTLRIKEEFQFQDLTVDYHHCLTAIYLIYLTNSNNFDKQITLTLFRNWIAFNNQFGLVKSNNPQIRDEVVSKLAKLRDEFQEDYNNIVKQKNMVLNLLDEYMSKVQELAEIIKTQEEDWKYNRLSLKKLWKKVLEKIRR